MLALVPTPTGEISVELRDVAEPEAAAHEAIVAVQASSLHRGQLILLAKPPERWRPGEDIAGIVVKAAADGSWPAEGSRVVGLASQGGWSERVALPTNRLVSLPDTISFAAAATLPVAGLTALRLLRSGNFLLGKRVLVTGAAGGIGHFAAQLAALAGAEVTGVVSHPERAAFLRERGVRAVVTTMQEAEGPFDLILEGVGGPSLIDSIRLVAPSGTIVLFGASSGESTLLNGYAFFGHENSRLQTFFLYGAEGEPDPIQADLRMLVSLTEAGRLIPQIGWEGSWHKGGQALRALRDRQVTGKAVLRLSEAH